VKVLLSIKPEFALKIFSGTKKYEYRKRVFAKTEVRTVLVYATKPIGLIVGEFDIAQTIIGSPSNVWQQTRKGSGITHSYYQKYYAGHDNVVAYEIEQVREFAIPISPYQLLPNFTAPQSYMYLPEDLLVLNDL
jgi:predicted transcriptional regulator